MNKFFKTFFASCLGAFVGLLALGTIVFYFGISSFFKSDNEPKVSANSVLHLTFEDPMPELTNNMEMSGFSLEMDDVLGLKDVMLAIDKAASDKNIKGIVLEPKFMSMGQAKAKVIRDKLIEFADDGKFVVAKADMYSQSGYYLASCADEIYMNPLGMIDLRGFAAQIPFFKDMLDRLGVKAQVFYAGQFKSATEPFRRNNISPENRVQIEAYLNDRYQILLDHISGSRDIPKSEFKAIVDGYKARTAEDALSYKLVDKLTYNDEFLTLLKNKLGLKEKDEVNFVSLKDYFVPRKNLPNQSAKDKIAVVYAEGAIVDGESKPGNIQGDKYANIFADLRKDDAIKAIVMRVNSGGGSGFASEKILREIEMCQAAGLPVVVSFGDVAASGGYYISLSADSIFAEPNSLTGSIGVFGLIPSFQKMMNEKLGINFDTVGTGKFSAAFTPFYDFNAEESAIMQDYIDDFYQDFITRVGKGRGMSVDDVHAIAQGRVWTGSVAVENGLVDALGGMDDAMAAAASLAGISNYKVRNYPKTKPQFEQLMEELTGAPAMVKDEMLKAELGDNYKHYHWLKSVLCAEGPQLRVPFILE